MKKLLKKIFSKLLTFFYSITKNSSINKKCVINGFCKFNGKEVFGDNINFNGCKIFGNGKVYFGDNFHSAEGLKIITSFHNYKGEKVPYDETIITKDVNIGENVWIGMDVIILGGVSIGEGVIIQAGSVVVKSIPPLSIVGGSPANVFSKRDEVHYYKLKQDNRTL